MGSGHHPLGRDEGAAAELRLSVVVDPRDQQADLPRARAGLRRLATDDALRVIASQGSPDGGHVGHRALNDERAFFLNALLTFG